MSENDSTKPFIPRLFERANEVTFDVVLSELGVLDQLKIVGDEIRGTCPICKGERSFSANPVKRVYNCFRCRKGGNVVKFVARFKNIVDDDAARWLVSLLPPEQEMVEESEGVPAEITASGLTAREVRLMQLIARAQARQVAAMFCSIIAPTMQLLEGMWWQILKEEMVKEFPDTVLPEARK